MAPDPIFAEPRLANIYDALDGDRADLDAYVAMTEEFGARSILDIGCGTGALASRLAGQDLDVTAFDPAAASLDVARRRPHAQRVRWILGDVACLPPLQVDLAVMTGNVAQVFVADAAWAATLRGVHDALRPGGLLVFETRDPSKQAWRDWTRERTERRVDIPGVGFVRAWCDVKDVSASLVRFRWSYVFETDGTVLVSDSTLRFRARDDIIVSLERAGYMVVDVRGAPDRPGLELVFIARRNC